MPETSERIRIAIHIDVLPGEAGGTAQSTQGLVHSLGQLEGPEQYLLSAQNAQQAEWIAQFQGGNQQIVVRESAQYRRMRNGLHPADYAGGRWKAALRPTLEALRRITDKLTSPHPRVPFSDGYYESLGCDVLHFPTQIFELCAVPSIYNPHDLLHLHYPQFFSPWLLAAREAVYRTACEISNTVVVGSEWIKQDVIRQYRVHPDKVQIIPWAPPTFQFPAVNQTQIEDARRRLALPDVYAFYPAVAWQHKNHLRLLQAMADLRDRGGPAIHLVCTGSRKGGNWPAVEQRIHELQLESQVMFLGFLSETDLRAVYRQAQFMVLPSLFEADSCPIHEAWSEGIPVASSSLTALPDQVGDAGLLFDAKDVGAIARALERMATEPSLRRELVERGYRRVGDFSWERTAKAFRAVYRRASGMTLGEEDRWLLEWDWMREPLRTPAPQETHA